MTNKMFLYKQTKVEYDAHMKEYNVFYKNWLFWKYECTYKVSEYVTDEKAKENAVARAKNMLDSYEVYRGSNWSV